MERRISVDLLAGVDFGQFLVLLFEDRQADDVVEVEDDAMLIDQVGLEPRTRVDLQPKRNYADGSFFKSKET